MDNLIMDLIALLGEIALRIDTFMGQKEYAANWISFSGWLVALLSFVLSLWAFHRQKRREQRIELQENYLRLELESNSLFRFEAEHGPELEEYKSSAPSDFYRRLRANENLAESKDAYARRIKCEAIADNFYLQQLNLFEIAARFRRDDVFAPHIFGSWVIWYYDVATSWWFREKWQKEYSDNYADDLYHIFTPMTQLFDDVVDKIGSIPEDDDDERARQLKKLFFDHVAGRFHCPIIKEWPRRAVKANKSLLWRIYYHQTRPFSRSYWRLRNLLRDTERLSPQAEHFKRNLRDAREKPQQGGGSRISDHATLGWSTQADERTEAAHFFARVINAAPVYISHGEIQTGLSLDGKSWVPDLEARFIADMADMDASRSLALARDDDGRIVGAAIVYWESTPRTCFGVLEDMAVAPEYRSGGLGARLSNFVDEEARKRGCCWLFLESGKNNTRAHAFFEQHGYEEISHVFVKPL